MRRGTPGELGIENTKAILQSILGVAAPFPRNQKASQDDTVFVVLFDRSPTLLFHSAEQNIASYVIYKALPRSALVAPLDVPCLPML